MPLETIQVNKQKKVGFFKQFFIGIGAYSNAISFIFKNKMAWTFLVPIVLSVLLFITGQTLISEFIDYLKTAIFNLIDLDNSGFWGGLIGGVLSFLINVLFFILFAFISGYIVIIIMSPIFSYLSEKTEKILTGNEYNANFLQIIKDIFRGVFIALRNLFIELLFVVLMFFVSFIPVIGWFSPVVLFIISAYFYGFSFIDYINERQQLSIKESIVNIKQNKGIAIGVGSVFAFSLLIPGGSFISIFVAIVSVVAAVISMKKVG